MNIKNSLNIHKVIAQAYIFLLTFRMISQLSFFAGIMHGAANYFDVVLHGLGLFLAVISRGGKLYIGGEKSTSSLLKSLSILVIWFCISSILMSVVIQTIYGNYAGETAFSGIVGQLVYYIQYVLIVVYNVFVFSILSKDEIDKALGASCIFLLCLGYYQFLMFVFGGVFTDFGRKADVLGVLFPPERMLKLSLTATEGAKAGGVFSILVLPYLFAKAMISDKPLNYYIQALLWIPIVVLMRSTAAYLMVFAVVIYFCFYLLKKGSKQRKKLYSFVISILMIGLIIMVFIPEEFITNVFNFDEFSYLVLKKLIDPQNGSTLLRIAPLIINWKTFLRFPIFGVGNGLQGYFYTEFFPQEGLRVAGVSDFYNVSQTTIINGALFFPSILSGYGIIGVGAFFIFLKKFLKTFKKKRKEIRCLWFNVSFCCNSYYYSWFSNGICRKLFHLVYFKHSIYAD